MLSVAEALERVLAEARPKLAVELPCGEALGLSLAEEVTSDVDSPPYDKSLVDGYAVRAGDLAALTGASLAADVILTVIERVTAGQAPTQAVSPGQATHIMTGAPIPPGADAVVMVEQTEALPSSENELGRVRIRQAVSANRNLIRQGVAMRAGDVVLRPGHVLRPIEVGLLAEVGRTSVRVTPRPVVAVLSTGDELIEPQQMPALGQIRNSNGPLLRAAAEALGCEPLDLGIARDDRAQLTSKIRAGLEGADVLVLSGGVSAGVLDLVPEVLRSLGVEERFHKVRMKPGKPLWFGVVPGPRLVFGLPGNPVSALATFHVFVRPALARMAGVNEATKAAVIRQLTAPFAHRGDRPTYHPGRLAVDGRSVEPLRWQGSADLRALAEADALICYPAGDRDFLAGESVEVIRL